MKQLNSSDSVQLRNCILGFFHMSLTNGKCSGIATKKLYLFFCKRKKKSPSLPQPCCKKYTEQFTAFLHIFIPFLSDIFFSNVGKHSASFTGNTNSLGRSKSLPC